MLSDDDLSMLVTGAFFGSLITIILFGLFTWAFSTDMGEPAFIGPIPPVEDKIFNIDDGYIPLASVHNYSMLAMFNNTLVKKYYPILWVYDCTAANLTFGYWYDKESMIKYNKNGVRREYVIPSTKSLCENGGFQ